MDLSSNSATQTGACIAPRYSLQLYGQAILLTPWSDQGSTFFPNDYDLPGRSPQGLTHMTVALKDPELKWDQFMTFVCKFGLVDIALWAPSKSWAVYPSAVDAQNCFRELLEKGYEVAMSNTPWNLPSWGPNPVKVEDGEYGFLA